MQSDYDLAPPYSDYTRVCDVWTVGQFGGSDAGGGAAGGSGGRYLAVCWPTAVVAWQRRRCFCFCRNAPMLHWLVTDKGDNLCCCLQLCWEKMYR